ncbi:hypothetical protein BJX66DRAFT_301705 [Aspergillus keveii]|uniref:Uncharacterized protein n=1 Tax=Aspergillus keveii TaxID=714993 RepID=A0ABR4G8X9_9EURO
MNQSSTRLHTLNSTPTSQGRNHRVIPSSTDESITSSFRLTSRTTSSLYPVSTKDYPSPNGPITLYAWMMPNCKGEWAQTEFDSVTFTKNNSNFYLSRSFKLSRPLEGQEQLDLSLAIDLSSWNSTKSLALKSPNPACDSFEQTYFALNGSADCHNTPACTCHRIWINPGLLF